MAKISAIRVTPLLSLLMLIASATGFADSAVETDGATASYEAPVVLLAPEVVPAELLRSEHHSVREHVINDGFVNQYVIDSEFGEFIAESNFILRVRVGEIAALARLDEISRTRVFVEAAGSAALDTVTAPVRTVTSIVTRPVGTITGLPGGVRRMFGRFSRRAQNAAKTAGDVAQKTGDVARDVVDTDADENAEGDDSSYSVDKAGQDAQRLADRYFKVSRGERRWAEKLNVDPYTDNEQLATALHKVGRIDRAGDLAVSFAPGAPGVRALDYLGMVNEAVWERDAFELKRINRERLRKEYGLTVNEAEAFLDNSIYTPTMQTVLINALLEVKGVPNLSEFIELAGAAKTVGEARYHTLTAVMLVWLSREEGRLGTLQSSGPVTMIVGKRGHAHVLMPVDHLAWTAALDDAITATSADIKRRKKRTLYLTGNASQRTQDELSAKGWKIRDQLADGITEGLIGVTK